MLGITPIVRVPGFEHHLATRALDGGALGIVVPHVDDLKTAKQMASNCRYPTYWPSLNDGCAAASQLVRHPIGEMAEAVNAATLLILMIETPQAVENADVIAAVEGVDVLLIGTNDLCMEMGIPGQFDHPDVGAAYDKVIAACHKHGKHPRHGRRL